MPEKTLHPTDPHCVDRDRAEVSDKRCLQSERLGSAADEVRQAISLREYIDWDTGKRRAVYPRRIEARLQKAWRALGLAQSNMLFSDRTAYRDAVARAREGRDHIKAVRRDVPVHVTTRLDAALALIQEAI